MDDFFRLDPKTFGTKGIVYVGDKIIVYRRGFEPGIDHQGELDLPGGGPEGNESPFETFAREVYEEFHLHIKRQDIVYAKRHESRQRPGNFAWFCVAKLPASAERGIVFGDEGTDWQLMSMDEYLASTNAWPVLQERAVEYLKSTSQMETNPVS